MEELVFEIFPERGIDQSLLFPVLVGLLVLFFFTEVFGWIFVGLIVPGYMASVAIVQPGAWVAMMFEAAATYGIVALLSRHLSRSGAWSAFFGRERFYVIVLTSVLVRQHSQLWVLPAIIGWLSSTFGLDLEPESGFMSIGLVLVPLAANMFWKLKFARGLLQIVVPTAITYLFLSAIILPHTNFSLSSMELTYEGLALSFISSPKAYIIMLVAALLASRLNLRYGWDFNGILVPTLLALAWMTPWKLATTTLEAMLLVALASLVSRAPVLRNLNLEGPRKVALVFTLGFLVKCAIGSSLGRSLPSLQATDLFGFGYLIPSLLAIKIIQKKSARRILIPTILTSLIAFILGNVVGLGLELLLPRQETTELADEADALASQQEVLTQSAIGVGVLARARAHPATLAKDGSISRQEYTQAVEFWRASARRFAAADEVDLRAARIRSRDLGFGTDRVQPREGTAEGIFGRDAFSIFELEGRLSGQRGRPSVLFFPAAAGPLVAVPRPKSQPRSVRDSLTLCAAVDCRAIVYAGVEPDSADQAEMTAFTAAVHGLGREMVITLHAEADGSSREHARMIVRSALPGDVNLSMIDPRGVDITWSGVGEAIDGWLSPAHQLALVVPNSGLPPSASAQPGVTAEREPMSGIGWLNTHRPTNTRQTQKGPSETELRAVEQLARELITASRSSGPSDGLEWAQTLAAEADALGLTLHILDECVGLDTACIALSGGDKSAEWGQILIRTGEANPVGIEVPMPLREPGTWRFAAEIWRSTAARALLLGPWATREGAAYSRRPSSPRSSFHALHRGLERALATQTEPLILQLRGLSANRRVSADVTIASTPDALPQRLVDMLDDPGSLAWLGSSVHIGVRGREYAGLTATSDAQFLQSRNAQKVHQIAVWISHRLRSDYFSVPVESEHKRGEWIDRPVASKRPSAALTEPLLAPLDGAPSPAFDARWDELLDLADRYVENRDIHVRAALLQASAADRAAAADDGAPAPMLEADTEIETATETEIETEIAWSEALSMPFIALRMRRGQEERRAVFLFAGADECPERHVEAEGAADKRTVIAALARRCRRITIRGRAASDNPNANADDNATPNDTRGTSDG